MCVSRHGNLPGRFRPSDQQEDIHRQAGRRDGLAHPEHLVLQILRQGGPFRVRRPSLVRGRKGLRDRRALHKGLGFLIAGLGRRASESFDSMTLAEIETAVAYMLSEGNVISRIDCFCGDTMFKGGMSDRELSGLFSSISDAGRRNFFKRWAELRPQSGSLAYGVTSFSSYSEGVAETEWGRGLGSDRLPQINMTLRLGRESLIPHFYSARPRSAADRPHLSGAAKPDWDPGLEDAVFCDGRIVPGRGGP